MPQLKEVPDRLRANATSRGVVAVDREANVLRGYVVAQEGPFKDGRGEFDRLSLGSIIRLMSESPGSIRGLRSNFGHATLSDDGLGKYLGRARNPRLDSVTVEGKTLAAVRADLHFDKTALEEPPHGGKPLGTYVMDLAESDPDAISSSLVLRAERIEQLDEKKRPKMDAEGNPLPAIWRPTQLLGSDIVAVGAAVDGILSAEGLSADGLPDDLIHRTCELLATAFPNASREVIAARIDAWKLRYLSWRFGDAEEEQSEPAKGVPLSVLRAKLEMMERQ